MRRPKLEEMTLREKLGQTGQPSSAVLRAGIEECGSYEAYIQKYPFGSIWISEGFKKADGTAFATPEEMGRIVEMRLARSTLTDNGYAVLTTCVDRLKNGEKKSENSPEDIRAIIEKKRKGR